MWWWDREGVRWWRKGKAAVGMQEDGLMEDGAEEVLKR